MGLDVYVGSLTRYYGRYWKTIVQQMAEAEARTVELHRLNDDPDAHLTPQQLRQAVDLWRGQLAQAAPPGLELKLDWPEEADTPYLTDKPGYDGYRALLFWTALAEYGPPKMWRLWGKRSVEDDATRAYDTFNARRDASDFTIQLEAMIWLPEDFARPIWFATPAREECWIGSVPRLVAMLDEVNRKTWKAEPHAVAAWRETLPGDDDFEGIAKFGFSIVHHLASEAAKRRLPLLMDH